MVQNCLCYTDCSLVIGCITKALKHESCGREGLLRAYRSNGFTIVELLIVIVIGILAAIVVVTYRYTGISTRANNTAKRRALMS